MGQGDFEAIDSNKEEGSSPMFQKMNESKGALERASRDLGRDEELQLIKDHPVRSAIAAASIGFLVGTLIRRK